MTYAIVVGIMCIVSFTIGAEVGLRVKKEEHVIEMPKIETYKERSEKRKEAERNRIIAENIDNYDGTSLGQQRIPD